RRREKRPRAPFEAVGVPVGRAYRGAPVPREHVEYLVVEMPGPVCCAAGRNFDQVQADEVAAAAQLDEGRAGATAEPRPGCGLDCVEIDRDALDDRNALARRPFAVGVDQITSTSFTISHGSPRLLAGANFQARPYFEPSRKLFCRDLRRLDELRDPFVAAFHV